MNDTIFFDVETTWLPVPSANDPAQQPHAIELCFIRGDEVFHSLVKPPNGIEISEEITKITGITNEDVADAPSFIRLFKPLAEFCLGARRWVAHNVGFDKGILQVEVERHGRILQFPWPLEWVCTYEMAENLPERKRPQKLNLGSLYEHATGAKLIGAHRAEADVRALIAVYNWLQEQA